MSHLSEQILQTVEVLPVEDQRQVLDFVQFILAKRQQAQTTESETEPKSFFEVAQASIGAGEGPGDLSTNPDAMQGYGQYFNVLSSTDIRLQGTRIGIETILYDYIYRSRTPEEIAKTYPSLNLEQVYATILYYLHNKAAVSEYLTTWIEHGDRMRAQQRQNPSALAKRLQQLKAESTTVS